MEGERLCVHGAWTDEAELFLNHHAERLGTIRSISARTRLQLLWRNYTYLRNSYRNKFTCASLQQKQAKALQGRLEQMERKMEHGYTTPVRPQQPRSPGGELRCARCKSTKVHPNVGADNCPFRGHRFKVSKAMGRVAERLLEEGKTKEEAIAQALESQ
jgi:hypothetical protein